MLVATVLLVGSVAAEELKSGPQPGQGVHPFNPLHVTGPNVGQRLCLI
jgi:hypothetical protein